jgi:hypothetical protein
VPLMTAAKLEREPRSALLAGSRTGDRRAPSGTARRGRGGGLAGGGGDRRRGRRRLDVPGADPRLEAAVIAARALRQAADSDLGAYDHPVPQRTPGSSGNWTLERC